MHSPAEQVTAHLHLGIKGAVGWGSKSRKMLYSVWRIIGTQVMNMRYETYIYILSKYPSGDQLLNSAHPFSYLSSECWWEHVGNWLPGLK